MTSLDRTPVSKSTIRACAWATVVTSLATLATVLILAFTHNQEAAVAVAATGGVGVLGAGAIQITVHIRR